MGLFVERFICTDGPLNFIAVNEDAKGRGGGGVKRKETKERICKKLFLPGPSLYKVRPEVHA